MTAPATAMMSLPWRNDIPRGGFNHETTILGIAAVLLELNRPDSFWAIGVAPAPTIASQGNSYRINGVIYGTSALGGLPQLWDLSSQPVVPPFRQITYLLLIGGTPLAQIAFPSVATPLGQPIQWAPSGPEALIAALNQGTGYFCAGFMTVTNNTPNPYTPGAAFPAAPFQAIAGGGTPPGILLPGALAGATPFLAEV